jgi:hypothetical protein
MDLDASVEFDSFSLALPLPYRVALIVVLGMSLDSKLQAVLTSRSCLGVGRKSSILSTCQNRMCPSPNLKAASN